MWGGESTISTTFTPLTINDADVNELTVYDSTGNYSFLDVSSACDSSEEDGLSKAMALPTEPIGVVGINESMALTGYVSNSSSSSSSSSAGNYPYITKIDLKKHQKHYEPWYAGKAELYYITYVTNTSTYSKDTEMSKDFDYNCWKLTWTGWHSNTPWRSWNHKIDPGYPNSISLIEIWEFDPWGHDGLMHDQWYEWDCDHLEDWPLIRDAINILCDIIQNVFNWGGNDDLVGGVAYLSLLKTEQTFEGTGLNIKMKSKWFND